MHPIARTASLVLALGLAMVPSATAQSPEPISRPSSSPATSPLPIVWSQISQDRRHPKAREDHTFTVDPDGRAAYLYGGRTVDGLALGMALRPGH